MNDSAGGIHKRDIGIQFLEEAILAYFSSKFLVALNLAGVAEELLGKYLQHKYGVANSVSELAEIAALIYAKSHPMQNDEQGAKVRKQLRERMSSAKNSVKHFDDPNKADFCFDQAAEAYDMLERATSNFYSLFQRENLPLSALVERFNLHQIEISRQED